MRELFPEDEKLMRWLDMASEKLLSKDYLQELHGLDMVNVQKWD